MKPDEADDVKPYDEADKAVLWLGLPLKAVAATGAVAGLAIACSLSICICVLPRGEANNLLESCSQGICET